jgi:hypothetical protein
VSRAFDASAARARCEAATPGPWSIVGAHMDYWIAGAGGWAGGPVVIELETRGPRRPRREDAEMMAAARTDLPAALDEIEALREALADARTSALEEAAAIADGYCGDGVALDQWTPRGDGERTRADIAREIRAAISAPRGDA